jgi:UDP-glucose 4-epimerase
MTLIGEEKDGMGILVTGGTGFIGSHTCLELLNAGYEVFVVDNLSNSKQESLRRVEQLTGKSAAFYQADLLDTRRIESIFCERQVEAVIHFAGLKAVAESVEKPLAYYRNNFCGTTALLEVMRSHGVKQLVFSSSSTVYGEPETVPVREDFPLNPPTNPYGRSKLMIEELLRDVFAADPSWNIALLRYFNPVGAHQSGRIGEDPQGIPNNLMPYVAQVAVGKRPFVRVTGHDYPTPDGTGIRDYIHVVDLAVGHIKALNKLEMDPGLVTYNLGTGRGYSVLEVIAAYGRAVGRKIPYRLVERRPGDIAINYADVSKAERELSWKAERDIDDMCVDSWRWQSMNPDGYD